MRKSLRMKIKFLKDKNARFKRTTSQVKMVYEKFERKSFGTPIRFRPAGTRKSIKVNKEKLNLKCKKENTELKEKNREIIEINN